MTWTSVATKLPTPFTTVEVKRDLSVGIRGNPGQLEWMTTGRYRGENWSLTATEGLTLYNSSPTHWREIKEKKK